MNGRLPKVPAMIFGLLGRHSKTALIEIIWALVKHQPPNEAVSLIQDAEKSRLETKSKR